MSSQVEHRLRLIQNLSVAGVSYGNAALDYGDGIYGERATDPANLQVYVAVPLTSGFGGSQHAFEARVGDVFPTNKIAFRVMAFGGPFEAGEGTILDLNTVDDAELRLDRISWGHAVSSGLELKTPNSNPPSSGTNTLERAMESTDLSDPGTYRMTVILSFVSGRRMTIPVQDHRTLHVSDGGAMQVAPPVIPPGGVDTFDLWTGGTPSTTGPDSLTMGTPSTTGADTITLGVPST